MSFDSIQKCCHLLFNQDFFPSSLCTASELVVLLAGSLISSLIFWPLVAVEFLGTSPIKTLCNLTGQPTDCSAKLPKLNSTWSALSWRSTETSWTSCLGFSSDMQCDFWEPLIVLCPITSVYHRWTAYFILFKINKNVKMSDYFLKELYMKYNSGWCWQMFLFRHIVIQMILQGTILLNPWQHVRLYKIKPVTAVFAL